MAEIVEFSSKVRQRPPPRSSQRRFGADRAKGEGTVLFLPCVRHEPIEDNPAGQDAASKSDRRQIR